MQNLKSALEMVIQYSGLATLVLIIATIILYLAKKKEDRNAKAREMLYEILVLLSDLRPEIERILSLEDKSFADWSEADRNCALNVCGRFHLIARLVQEKMIKDQVLAEMWYYSIPKCYDILRPFLADIREKRHKNYWIAFDALTLSVIRRTRAFNPSAHVDCVALSRELEQWKRTHPSRAVVELEKAA